MCFFFFFLIRVWIFCHMSHVTKHTYPHTHMLTYKGTYKHPSPLSCLIITFLPFLYRGTPFCLLAQLLHAKPEGQRSALFITTVIQQRCLLPSGFTVTVAVSAVWPPDPMGESHQTLRFLQDVLRELQHIPPCHRTYHQLLCFAIVHLKALTPGSRPVKPQSFTGGNLWSHWVKSIH